VCLRGYVHIGVAGHDKHFQRVGFGGLYSGVDTLEYCEKWTPRI
jgi:hypothetical protein